MYAISNYPLRDQCRRIRRGPSPAFLKKLENHYLVAMPALQITERCHWHGRQATPDDPRGKGYNSEPDSDFVFKTQTPALRFCLPYPRYGPPQTFRKP